MHLSRLQEAKLITGEVTPTRWVLWNVPALDFSFMKLDIMRCYVRVTSGQWLPKDQYGVRDMP